MCKTQACGNTDEADEELVAKENGCHLHLTEQKVKIKAPRAATGQKLKRLSKFDVYRVRAEEVAVVMTETSQGEPFIHQTAVSSNKPSQPLAREE